MGASSALVAAGRGKDAEHLVHKSLAHMDHAFKVKDHGLELGGAVHHPQTPCGDKWFYPSSAGSQYWIASTIIKILNSWLLIFDAMWMDEHPMLARRVQRFY